MFAGRSPPKNSILFDARVLLWNSERTCLRRSRVSLWTFGALAAIIIYGGMMNPASALMWAGELNWKIIVSYYISGFPMDCVHAAAIWIFLWFAAEPMLEKLDRIKVKYGSVE